MHQNAIYYKVESRLNIKLFRLITLIPMLLLILKCLNSQKKDKTYNPIVDEWRSESVESGEGK